MQKTREITIPSSLDSITPVKTRHGREVYADNPYLEGFALQVRRKSVTVAAGLSIKDSAGDDVSAGTVAMYKEVDVEEFVKVYVQNVQIFFELSSSAQKVLVPLMYIIQKTAKDKAHVFFSPREAQEACLSLQLKPISKATYHRGIKDLIQAQFIAVHINGAFWYWINPNVLFNGNRVDFIKAYKIKRQEEKQRIEQIEQHSLLPQSNPLIQE